MCVQVQLCQSESVYVSLSLWVGSHCVFLGVYLGSVVIGCGDVSCCANVTTALTPEKLQSKRPRCHNKQKSPHSHETKPDFWPSMELVWFGWRVWVLVRCGVGLFGTEGIVVCRVVPVGIRMNCDGCRF